MNANPPLETAEEQAPAASPSSEQQLVPQPEPVPPSPIRPLAETKAELESALARYKAFTGRLTSDSARLEAATREEAELLEQSDSLPESEQLERLTRTLALKMVLERKLERGQESGLAAVTDELGSAVAAGLRSLQRELGDLLAKREAKHLAGLKKQIGEEQWPWAENYAKALIRHFPDIRGLDTLALLSADYSLSHGAILAGAEQALADIAAFEAEKAARR